MLLRFLGACLASSAAGAPSPFSFRASPALDLQPLFDISAPWLGGDVATSVPLGGGASLWLHGDTLVGSFSGGVRAPTGMPRNSVALLNSSSLGVPSSRLAHYIKVDAEQPVHFGWFTPPNASRWYWPTLALNLGGQGEVFVVAMCMFNAGSGLFPFAMAGMDVLRVSAAPAWDPPAWPAPALVATLPIQRDNFTMGCAAAHDAATGLVYLLGAAGPHQTALLARLPAAGFAAGDFTALQFWMPSLAWEAPPADGSPPYAAAFLFDFTPSETTLVWHPVMRAWYVVVANTFIYGSSIGLRTAPAITGPWSDFAPVYTVPPEMMAGGVFCYAGKAHAELSPVGAPELVFSFMCNTDGIPPLLNRSDIYVPQLIRVAVLGLV